jgi:UDP-glucose:O-linked fucose beta-1,3-glucosyltransferase
VGFEKFKPKLFFLTAANEVVNKRGEIVNLKADLQDKQIKLEKAKKNQSEVKAKLARVQGDTMTLEAKSQEV